VRPRRALPGRRLLARLETSTLGRPLVAVDRIDTTMSLARSLHQKGFPDGTTVLAAEQTAGRGRAGRAFVSPRGGLYMTVQLAALDPPADSWRFGFAAALAARDSITGAGGPAIALDWPNDLLVGDTKVGGTLLELVGGSGPGARVLMGLGLNVATPPADLDTPDAGPAGPLPELASDEPLAEVGARYLSALEGWSSALRAAQGWSRVLQSFRDAFAPAVGQRVKVERPDGSIVTGETAGIATDGSLLIRRRCGDVVSVRHARRVYR